MSKEAHCKYPKCSYPCPDLPDCRDAEQPAQQEPFGYFRYDLRLDAWVQNRAGIQGTPFYTSPPAQRTWVGLTNEEIEQACVPLGAAMLSFTEVSRAIEAKLKEKNT